MACCAGGDYVVCLSDDDTVYYLENNNETQEYTKHNPFSSLSNLPKIKQVSCNSRETICVDEEGFVWSIVNNIKSPQKIEDIPPMQTVSCGKFHVLLLGQDSHLWSYGNNRYGQLFLGTSDDQTSPQQTSFFNVSRIATGTFHSMFQNNEGEIYGCGYNHYGQLGNGRNYKYQTDVCLIKQLPLNIQISCGNSHSLLLDEDGNVFSTGDNATGSLGIGDDVDKNFFCQIFNIPPIQFISVFKRSSFLIDFDGNIWSFGDNFNGQLGHGDTDDRNIPTKINSLTNIKQISYGCDGEQVFVKDSQNKIYGIGNRENIYIPQEIEINHEIWGDSKSRYNKAKSARK